MKETLYSNLLVKSYDLFEEARKNSINLMNQNRLTEIRDCWSKVIDITRRASVVSSYEDFKLESAEKTAVIIMGLSCTGKSTIARVLGEKYPSFDVIRFDELGMQLIKEDMLKYLFTPNLLDTDMILRMGELMEKTAKSKRNVIIEGEYCSLNARGALMKALRTYGYKKIFLISTLSVPSNIMKVCAEKRSLIHIYANQLEKTKYNDFMLRTFYEDVIPEIESSMDVHKVMRSEQFRNHIQEIELCRKKEFVTDMIPTQDELDLLLAGADLAADWF